MAAVKYFSNGQPWFDDGPVPNQQTKTNDETFTWWHGHWADHAADDLASPSYDCDPWAIIARRELFRNMGGKPASASQTHWSGWKQEAALLVLMMSREPCGAFSSRPKLTLWNYRAWAALCNWYFWLDPKHRYEFLQDVSAGKCHVWMRVVLAARKNVPEACWNDPTYVNAEWDLMRIQQTGDDPANTLGGTQVAVAKFPPDYVGECDQGSWTRPHTPMCFSGYPSTTSWPVIGLDGVPLAIPGLPLPCTPFPQCIAQAIPIAPCSPMPECLFTLAADAASFVPNAAVTRTAQGGTYLPAKGPTDPPAKAPEDNTWLWIAGGVGGALALALVGLTVRAFSDDRTA